MGITVSIENVDDADAVAEAIHELVRNEAEAADAVAEKFPEVARLINERGARLERLANQINRLAHPAPTPHYDQRESAGGFWEGR